LIGAEGTPGVPGFVWPGVPGWELLGVLGVAGVVGAAPGGFNGAPGVPPGAPGLPEVALLGEVGALPPDDCPLENCAKTAVDMSTPAVTAIIDNLAITLPFVERKLACLRKSKCITNENHDRR